jgi:hypothetical protein
MFAQEIRWSVKSIGLLALVVFLPLALVSGPVLYGALRTRGPLPLIIEGIITGVIFACLCWIFRKLSVTVDDRQIKIELGPFNGAIRLEQIEDCSPITYSWLEWVGLVFALAINPSFITCRAIKARRFSFAFATGGGFFSPRVIPPPSAGLSRKEADKYSKKVEFLRDIA